MQRKKQRKKQRTKQRTWKELDIYEENGINSEFTIPSKHLQKSEEGRTESKEKKGYG